MYKLYIAKGGGGWRTEVTCKAAATVDWEIFAVKIFFRQLLRQRKLNVQKF